VVEWDRDDPRVEELSEAIVAYEARSPEAEGELDDPTAMALLASHFNAASSPALERLYELVEGKRTISG
jgi:hypothetical protein